MYRRHYIRFFISSTFLDMELERNILSQIFAKLSKEYQQKEGWQVEYVDLRWGISDEASTDNRTMSICLNELRRCQELSPRPNFIVLLGERYGWTPLPEKVMYKLGKELSNFNKNNKFGLYYRHDLNDNSFGDNLGAWVLMPYSKEQQQNQELLIRDTNTLLESFRKIAYNKSLRDSEIAIQISSSATEQEIYYGALNVEDAAKHVVAYLRDFTELPDSYKEVFQPAIELDKLNALKIRLKNKVGTSVNAKVSYRFYSSEEFVRKFTENMESQIRRVIDAEIAKTREEGTTLLDREIAQKENYLLNTHKVLYGRQAELRAVREFLFDKPDSTMFWIEGEKGIGKSALIAQTCRMIAEYNKTAKPTEQYRVFYYRCGLTKLTSNALGLNGLIEHELYNAYPGKTGKAKLHRTLEELENSNDQYYSHGHLKFLLSEICENISGSILFIFDNYSAIDKETIGDFFPLYIDPKELNRIREKTHSSIRVKTIVTSSTPDFRNPSLTIQPLNHEVSMKFLDSSLRLAKRSITEQQRRDISNILACKTFSPQYLKVLTERLNSLNSWSPVPEIPTDIHQLLSDLINHIIKTHHHNSRIAWLCLTIIALDKGCSDHDLMNMLSLDNNLLSEFQKMAHHNWIHKDQLPPIFWHRLSNDMRALIDYQLSPYGVVNAIKVEGFADIIIGEAKKMQYTKGVSYYEQALRLQYKYFQNNWREGNLHALYRIAELTKRQNGLPALYNLLHDLRFTVAYVKHFPNRMNHLFDEYLYEDIGSQNTTLEHFREVMQISNWLRKKDGYSYKQIMQLVMGENPKCPIRNCKIDRTGFRSQMGEILYKSVYNEPVLFSGSEQYGDLIAISPDARLILYMNDDENRLTLVDRVNCKKVERKYKAEFGVRVSDDLSRIAVRLSDGTIEVLNAKGFQQIATITNSDTKTGRWALSHDGNFIANLQDKELSIVSISLGKTIRKVTGRQVIYDFEFSKCDNYLWILDENFSIARMTLKTKDIWFCNFKDRLEIVEKSLERQNILDATEDICVFGYLGEMKIITIESQNSYSWSSHMTVESNSPDSEFNTELVRIMPDKRIFAVNHRELGEIIPEQEYRLINVRRVPYLEHITPDLRFGVTESGDIVDLKKFATIYENTAQEEMDDSERKHNTTFNAGINSTSSDMAGSWIFESSVIRHDENMPFVHSVVVGQNGIFVKTIRTIDYPYREVESINTGASAVSPDGTMCAVASIYTNMLDVMLLDREFKTECLFCVQLFDEKVHLNDKKLHFVAFVRNFNWSSDSRYLICTRSNHYSFGGFRNLDTIIIDTKAKKKIVNYLELEDRACDEPQILLSADNRYVIHPVVGVGDEFVGLTIIDLDSGKMTRKMYREFQVGKSAYSVMHPSGKCVYTIYEGNLILFFTVESPYEDRKLVEKVDKVLAVSPSGRYIYIESPDGLLQFDLGERKQKKYPFTAKQVICTYDDKHIYVRTKEGDILLVDSATGVILQEAFVEVLRYFMTNTQRGLLVTAKNGTLRLFTPDKDLKVNEEAIVTVIRHWDFETHTYGEPIATCSHCGKTHRPPQEVISVLNSDDQCVHRYDMQQASNPILHSHVCPHCSGKISYNYYTNESTIKRHSGSNVKILYHYNG